MTADHALHVRETADDGFQFGRAFEQTDLVHVTDQRLKRWVVHGDHYGLVAVLFQLGGEPVQTLLAQGAVALTGGDGVQRDQLHAADRHAVLHVAIGAPVGVLGEAGAQLHALVVVAGQQVDGHVAQRCQQLAQMVVFRGATEVGQVTGDDQRVRRLREATDRCHGITQVRSGVDAAIGQAARFADVRIGDLCEHRHAAR